MKYRYINVYMLSPPIGRTTTDVLRLCHGHGRFASYSSASGAHFGQLMRGMKRDKSGRIFFFPWVDMGYPNRKKVSPIYPNGLSRNIVPLRPSRVTRDFNRAASKH
eukprot:1859485-Pleurochrysis_carterae.AAC.2